MSEIVLQNETNLAIHISYVAHWPYVRIIQRVLAVVIRAPLTWWHYTFHVHKWLSSTEVAVAKSDSLSTWSLDVKSKVHP